MSDENNYFLNLKTGRGSKLFQNNNSSLLFTLQHPKIIQNWENIWLIKENKIGSVLYFYPEIETTMEFTISPNENFMILNFTENELIFSVSKTFSNLFVIYNPYLFENIEKTELNPKNLLKKYEIPQNYLDILAKWYSVKFSYADYNLIFLRPELGISLQSHELRAEHWEIISGSPIIINQNNVHYNVNPNDEFDIPYKALHTIINPSKDSWVLLKETYEGEFDEEDIIRKFNPNNYG